MKYGTVQQEQQIHTHYNSVWQVLGESIGESSQLYLMSRDFREDL